MRKLIRRLLAPPSFEEVGFEGYRGRVLYMLLLTLFVLATLSFVATIALASDNPPELISGLVFTGVLALLILWGMELLRRGYFQLVSWAVLGLLYIAFVYASISRGGVGASVFAAYIVYVVIAGLLLGAQSALFAAAFSILTGAIFLYFQTQGVLPTGQVALVDSWVTQSLLAIFAATLLYTANRALSRAFDDAEQSQQQLQEIRRTLEETVSARTQELQRRARYLEAALEVGRDAASELAPQELFDRAVYLISEQFDFYHTGIFMVDEAGEWAVLQAASSEGGQRMLARGHRLAVGRTGMVGYVTRYGEPRISLDVGEDAVYFDNPDLPETHSAVTLPLRARNEIIGALDVQSRQPAAFSEEDITVLQGVADLLGLAISNAQLFERLQDSLVAERRAYGELSREAWRKLLLEKSGFAYRSDTRGVVDLHRATEHVPGRPPALSPSGEDDLDAELLRAALNQGVLVRQEASEVDRVGPAGSDGGEQLAIPIKVSGEVIGVIDTFKPGGGWTEEELSMIEELTERVGGALESARFYYESQQRSYREQLTIEVAERIRASLDVDTILRTAAREIGEALGVDELTIQLQTEEEAQS